jgi:hypothetical protein
MQDIGQTIWQGSDSGQEEEGRLNRIEGTEAEEFRSWRWQTRFERQCHKRVSGTQCVFWSGSSFIQLVVVKIIANESHSRGLQLISLKTAER